MQTPNAPHRPSKTPRRLVQTARRSLLVVCALSICSVPLAAQSETRAEPPTSLERATAIAEELLRQRQDPVAAALERAERTRLEALETEASWSRQAQPALQDGGEAATLETPASFEAYAGAVAALATTPDPRILSALSAAASHSDAAVRYAAMTALREGPSAGQPGSPALLAARALVLGDEHPEVRRQAFEAYCRWGDQDDVLALSQSLGSAPGPVRDLAVREWLRIERERSAR